MELKTSFLFVFFFFLQNICCIGVLFNVLSADRHRFAKFYSDSPKNLCSHTYSKMHSASRRLETRAVSGGHNMKRPTEVARGGWIGTWCGADMSRHVLNRPLPPSPFPRLLPMPSRYREGETIATSFGSTRSRFWRFSATPFGSAHILCFGVPVRCCRK